MSCASCVIFPLLQHSQPINCSCTGPFWCVGFAKVEKVLLMLSKNCVLQESKCIDDNATCISFLLVTTSAFSTIQYCCSMKNFARYPKRFISSYLPWNLQGVRKASWKTVSFRQKVIYHDIVQKEIRRSCIERKRQSCRISPYQRFLDEQRELHGMMMIALLASLPLINLTNLELWQTVW